jgi:surface polysaccharide O-acyltransferase-like enzyme
MEHSKIRTNRIIYIDVLNVMACFAVIVLHSSGAVSHFSETRTWYVSLFIQTIAHWAVAVFFMIYKC